MPLLRLVYKLKHFENIISYELRSIELEQAGENIISLSKSCLGLLLSNDNVRRCVYNITLEIIVVCTMHLKSFSVAIYTSFVCSPFAESNY